MTNDIKVVLGNFKAQVGKEQDFLGTIGKHSLRGDLNDNSMRLTEFAASGNMCINSKLKKGSIFPLHKVYIT